MHNNSSNNAEENSNNSDNRSLSGLNFRDLVNSLESEKPKTEENNILFTDTFSQPIISDNNIAGEKPRNNFFKRFYLNVKTKSSVFINRFFLLRFFRDFFAYLTTRFRVVLVLMAVFAEVLGAQVELLKKVVIKRMFWGRGSLFNFSVKFFGVFLVLLILLSGVYRGRTIQASYQIAAQAGDPNTKEYQGEVIVQNSNVFTQYNEEAVPTDFTDYIVKGGDTLSTIAENNGISVDSIIWANSDLSGGDLIKPGMTLKIPPGNGLRVVVKEGDTVESLASKYQVNAQNIIDINKNVLEPPDFKLAVGTELFLPDGVMPEAPKPKPAPAPIYSGVISSGGSASTGTPAPATGGGRWLGWPVSGGGMLTQCYSGWHNGIDIADKSYPSVLAAAPGKVVFSGCQSGSCPALNSYSVGGRGLAWTVIIDHGNGFSTIYGHLNNLYVSSGQSVSQGTPIGQMGQTGLAYGVHLHFMLVYSGTWSSLNPARYMTSSICGY